MKGKTFHALLLSLVMVAGAMTINDAFAQTNTERLITVIDTTADTNAKVSSLVDLWADFDSHFTPIMSAIDDLSGDLSMVSDKVSMVSDDVMSVNSKISAFESKFDAFVAADAEHAEDNKMNYDSFAQMLPEIQGTVDQIAEDTNASLGTVSDKLEDLEGQISQFTSTIETLQGDVGEIKDELGLVQSSVEERIGPAPVDLMSGYKGKMVPLSWYTQGLTSVPSGSGGTTGTYSANFIFVCESDVFVDKATTKKNVDDIDKDTVDSSLITMSNVNFKYSGGSGTLANPIYLSDRATAFTTEITVDGNTLFNSKFDHGGDNVVVYDRNVNFGLMELKAGNAIKFKSSVHDTGSMSSGTNWGPLEFIANTTKNTDVAADVDGGTPMTLSVNNDNSGNVTKAQLSKIEAHSVIVTYFSSVTDAKCIITPSKTAELDDTDKVTFVSYKAPTEGDLIQDYTRTLSCDLNPTKITSITGYISGASDLNNYITMELEVGDEKKGKFTFKDNVSMIMDEESLPIDFHGADLTISGKITSGASLLIEVRYDTVANGECVQQ